MIGLLRVVGWLLIGLGTLTALTWFIAPLRQLWPLLIALPLPVQIGIVIAVLGVVILFGSLLYERWENREADSRLRDD